MVAANGTPVSAPETARVACHSVTMMSGRNASIASTSAATAAARYPGSVIPRT